MGPHPEPSSAEPVAAIYRRALPQVYGYLLPRCGAAVLAEDLTAETFMAAVAAVRDGRIAAPEVTVPWLVGVARHKLADHWRRAAREQRGLAEVAVLAQEQGNDPWDEHLDMQVAHAALARLNGFQRAALTLRYLDGLPVAEVAACLDRSLHATETLLARARSALRRVYLEEGSEDA
jgi:RNA polymerase sigma-70 factor (ECF subfamily)